MAEKKTGATASTAGDLILDAGVLYIKKTSSSDYVKVGVTRGGGTWEEGIPHRDIEYDNSRGAVKGFVTKDKGNPILTLTGLEMTIENLDNLMPGMKVDGITLVDSGQISDDDYLYEVKWVGNRPGECDKLVEIILKNVLQTQDISVAFADNDEATVPATFMGHFNLEDTPDSEGWLPEPWSAVFIG